MRERRQKNETVPLTGCPKAIIRELQEFALEVGNSTMIATLVG